MQRKRVMRFIGNRPVPEPELFDRELLHPIRYFFGVDLGQRMAKSLSIADLREFSKTCPNPLTSDFGPEDKKVVTKELYLSSRTAAADAINHVMTTYGDIVRNLGLSFPVYELSKVEEEPQVDPERFEVNLTEPLVGWRRWEFTSYPSSGLGLRSFNAPFKWKPCEPFVAKCTAKERFPYHDHGKAKHQKELVPFEKCTCGIYAVDEIGSLPYLHYHNETLTVTGLVYGWGRYVRGEQGWRCQFAYPKEFHLRNYQADLIEPLKAFRVPIVIDEPIRIYNPEDEGYTNEYRPNEENRDLGTSPESGPTED